MLRSLNLLVGTPVQAPDGEAGSVESALFDDEQWVVRYLVLGGAGLGGKRLLVSPYGLEAPTAEQREFRLRVTREQLQRAPEFTPDAPVSREWERGYLRFFAWPLYWGGGSSGLWGAGNYPGLLVAAPTASDPTPDVGVGAEAEHEEGAEATSHLHAAEGYKGYAVTAQDGTEIGEIDDFLVDDQTWALAYVAVHSPGWLGGKRILVPAESFAAGATAEGRVDLPFAPETLRSAPEWEPLEVVTEEYERRLHEHYGPPRYLAGEPSDEDEAPAPMEGARYA